MSVSSAIKSGLSFTADKKSEPLPHPGVFYGAYPGKKLQDKSKFEEFIGGIASFAPKPEAARKKHWKNFTARVEAMDKPLSK